jgi:phosphoglucosamine mutase
MTARFGTDGVRGLANSELTPELALALARASVRVFAGWHARPSVLVARDTRASGDMLEAAVIAGVCSGGADAVSCGVIPTPALAHLVPATQAVAGVMVSASHNTYQYNGLKFFDQSGDKPTEEQEAAIESLALAGPTPPSERPVGRAHRGDGWLSAYRGRLLAFASGRPLAGMRLAVDCANGALSHLAPTLLGEMAADVIAVNCSPSGTNINEGGAMKPQQLARTVAGHKADAGLAFDGDGDRLLMADERGELVDGDQVLAVWAKHLALRGELTNGVVVGTTITNTGVEIFLNSLGCRLLRAPVGDRYVALEMRRAGAVLGGETCGHTIYAPHLSSSDALLTGIAILSIMARSGKPLSELASVVQKRPQSSLNLRVAPGSDGLGHPAVRLAITEAEAALAGRGRLVVRPSGTEPVIRVTCECEDATRAAAIAKEIAAVIASCVGGTERVCADIAA